MTPTASLTLPLPAEQPEAPARTDLSAATGILAGVAMSAVFWTAIGYAMDAMFG
jgi:hypothetical protein